MNWIKSRKAFLNESKIRDLVLEPQARKIKEMWGERFLDFEEIEPTKKINQGTWKLSEEDKMSVFSTFFDCDMYKIYQIFEKLPDRFVSAVNNSIDMNLIKVQGYKDILIGSNSHKFDMRCPTVDQIVLIYTPIFRRIAVNETKSSEMVSKDYFGKPITKDGNIVKIQKEPGEIVYGKDLVNVNSFIDDYNKCFPDDSVDGRVFLYTVDSIRNRAKEDVTKGKWTFDMEIFGKDLYLSILHNPKDLLNVSISKFFSSCQDLYTGVYRGHVLSNVFDPNTIPAYLKFDSPIFNEEGEKVSDMLPLTRLFIRNMENFDDSKTHLFFDDCYPEDMKSITSEMIEKYSGNKNDGRKGAEHYVFTPDISSADDLANGQTYDKIIDPYQDTFSVKRFPYIGVNCRTLYLTSSFDWTDVRVSQKANIREMIIETERVPKILFEKTFNLDWVKFKNMKINTLSVFKIITEEVSFDKCRVSPVVFTELQKMNIKNLQLVASDIENIDFSGLVNLKELGLIYSLDDPSMLIPLISELNLSSLTISGDLLSDTKNKQYINSLKKKGVKVKIEGPIL